MSKHSLTNMVSTLNRDNQRVANVVLFHPQHCRWRVMALTHVSKQFWKRYKRYKVLQRWNIKVYKAMVSRIMYEKFKRSHTASLNCLNQKIHPNYLNFSSYCALNALYLDEDDKLPSSVYSKNIMVICSGNHTKYINAFCGQNTIP